MKALFIGQSYIDVTFLADELPKGTTSPWRATTRSRSAAMPSRRRSAAPASGSRPTSWPRSPTTIWDACSSTWRRSTGFRCNHRKVKESSLSFIMPKDGQRAIVRCRDDHYLHPFPPLNLEGCRALHVDGHQGDAAIHYAKACRQFGVMTSLDGGGLRSNTHDLLGFIDVAIVAERLCEQMHLSPGEMLGYLRGRGCKVGGVTMGSTACSGTTRTARTGSCRRCACRPRRSSTATAPVTSSMAPMCSRSYHLRRVLGIAFPLRARRLGLFDPAPRQRGKPADAGGRQ